MSACLPILVIGRVGGGSGYDCKGSAISGALNLNGGFIVGVIFPVERYVTVLFHVSGQIGGCRWHHQRHCCGIRIGRAASRVKGRYSVGIRLRRCKAGIGISGNIPSDRGNLCKCRPIYRTVDSEASFIC